MLLGSAWQLERSVQSCHPLVLEAPLAPRGARGSPCARDKFRKCGLALRRDLAPPRIAALPIHLA
eukprot:7230761-Pyramimonas_sp.AAC.2